MWFCFEVPIYYDSIVIHTGCIVGTDIFKLSFQFILYALDVEISPHVLLVIDFLLYLNRKLA